MPAWTAIAHPGLEPVVARELRSAGLKPAVTPGGVCFEAPAEHGPRLVRQLRTPDRLLLEIARGPADTLDALAALVRGAPWSAHIHPKATVDVSASARRSRMMIRENIERKTGFAIRDALRASPRHAGAAAWPHLAQRVQVRIDQDEATVSLDAGGELLHKRGWRAEAAKAPLRESIAASLLLLAGWSGDEALVDPFCGSGTIPIEAALLAAGRSPFGKRWFAADEWPLAARAPAPRGPAGRRVEVPIVGSDHHGPSVGIATSNADKAGVRVDFRVLDVGALTPPAPTGLLLSNPPWGQRLGQDVRGVYTTFGRLLAGPFAAWRALFLCPDAELAQRVHPQVRRLTRITLGGAPVGVWAVGD
jgi:putative N6-adenine-specific DNA methylase